MFKPQISITVTLFCCFWCAEIYAQCVSCERDARQKIFFCRSAGAGGSSCATSTGQTQCTLIGVCGSRLCNTDTIGEVAISKEIIEGISTTSTVYSDAVAFVAASGRLGSTYTKVLFFPDYKEREKDRPDVLLPDDRPKFVNDLQVSSRDTTDLIEVVMEIIYTDNTPSTIKIATTKPIDGVPASIELNIRRQPGATINSNVKNQWIITSWEAK